MRLPQRTQALETGNVAIDALSSTLNRFANVISIPNEKDLGIDLVCELFESNIPTGVNFFVQCKGTEEAKNNKKSFSISIKVSTINYWLIKKAPVLLMLVDLKKQKFYWAYPYEQIENRLEKIQNNKTVNIKISKEFCFSYHERDIPNDMEDLIKEYDYTDILMKLKELEHGVSLRIGDINELYKELIVLKEQEEFSLQSVDLEFLQYVRKTRDRFNYFFVTSDIRVWYKNSDQLCFFLFKKTDNGSCYYIADVIIYKNYIEKKIDHVIELTNKYRLKTSGNILERFDEIVWRLNNIY